MTVEKKKKRSGIVASSSLSEQKGWKGTSRKRNKYPSVSLASKVSREQNRYKLYVTVFKIISSQDSNELDNAIHTLEKMKQVQLQEK